MEREVLSGTKAPQVSRKEVLGGREAHGVFPRECLSPHVGARAAGVHGREAHLRKIFTLIGEELHHRFRAGLADGVGAPVGPGLPPHAGAREEHEGIRALFQHGQECLRKKKGAFKVHGHHLRARSGVVMAQGKAGPQQAGIVQKPIEAPKLIANGVGQLLGMVRAKALKIRGLKGRFGMACANDFIKETF